MDKSFIYNSCLSSSQNRIPGLNPKVRIITIHSARDGVFQTELSVSRPSPPHYKKRGIYTSTYAILKNLNIDVNFSERDKKY